MSTREERTKEIAKLILDAMKVAEGVDWAMRSEEISTAFDEMNEAMERYAEGTATKAEIKAVYQRYRDLHKTGGLFT